MSVDDHDKLLALTSHLSHVLAFALVSDLSRNPRHQELFELAAGGFYDFTRIASSDAVMWRDICMTNSGPILDAVEGFQGRLEELAQAIAAKDGAALEAWFRSAKAARDQGLEKKRLR